MRTLLVLVALLAGGYAGYRGLVAQTSYSSHSPAQLDELEAEHQRQLLKARGEAFDTHQLSLTLLREERSRRFEVRASLGVAGLSFVSALVLTLVSLVRSRRRAGTSGDEEPQATPEPIGHYRSAGKASRAQAAALLGVRPDAPRAVIEAALQAQLAERDPSHLHGLDPELRQRVLQQREALLQAANLLLGRQEISLPSDVSQG
jgi:hypothetical protein